MSNSSGVKGKILSVEDEPSIRQVCRRTLTSQGYQVDFAQNGVVAESMLMKGDYDLLLVDIKTPVMDGKQLYRYIKKRYPELADRVIFTTGDVASDDTRSFLERTARPFLLKPFSPDELRALVRESLKRWQGV
ncbi:MAG: response regulator [Deltaproteobacteria bacterium]|nr:response regulator [Deltaproteobacteria bacterium]